MIGKRKDSRRFGVSSFWATSLLNIGSGILHVLDSAGGANCTGLERADLLRALVQVPFCSSFWDWNLAAFSLGDVCGETR